MCKPDQLLENSLHDITVKRGVLSRIFNLGGGETGHELALRARGSGACPPEFVQL